MSAAPYLVIFGWLAFVYSGFPLFYGDTSLSFKRRFFRPHVFVSGCLGMAALAMVRPWSLVLAVPLLAFLMHRQITGTPFCGTCARPSANRHDVFCARCGDRLPERA